MIMLSGNIDDVEQHLKMFASHALPHAARSTLNSAAFNAQREAKSFVKDEMTNRNKFTMQSIRVDQVKSMDVSKQYATMGSTAGYMKDQQEGRVITGGVSLATSYSAGQGEGEKRTRLPRKANQLKNIQLQRKIKGKNKKQLNIRKIQEAVKTGSRIIYLDLGKRKGIFKVVGGKKGFKRGWPDGAKIRMLHDMTLSTVVIPKSAWLSTAVDKTEPLILDMYKSALMFQLKRNKIMGY